MRLPIPSRSRHGSCSLRSRASEIPPGQQRFCRIAPGHSQSPQSDPVAIQGQEPGRVIHTDAGCSPHFPEPVVGSTASRTEMRFGPNAPLELSDGHRYSCGPPDQVHNNLPHELNQCILHGRRNPRRLPCNIGRGTHRRSQFARHLNPRSHSSCHQRGLPQARRRGANSRQNIRAQNFVVLGERFCRQ